eukprot:CAMPEP_0183506150 /NCGR_PEP_ID=MMETSP0371-20130417/7210_1 /TAXON_ID=268820 /ORGANISM="Peridinium aciculiferum, Strain PAER-2" /LENGTH=57 /DNA_ID=CAMNT_0025702007 /DNA_START=147 /DNA_END=316 /DNA_ORIENTATION=+
MLSENSNWKGCADGPRPTTASLFKPTWVRKLACMALGVPSQIQRSRMLQSSATPSAA